MLRTIITVTALLLLGATNAWAVQEHGGDEAFYLHQMAHVFFVASMVLLIAVLRKPFALKSLGWRKMRLSAFFFICWNVDAFITHMADAYIAPQQGYISGHTMAMLDAYAYLFYFGSLSENLFLALAFILLALGLRDLRSQLDVEVQA